jgi:hypothetical protein
VAERSAGIDAMSAFYESNHVNVVRMPFASSLAGSLNALVREIREDFFLLCDEDFVLGAHSNVADAVSVLKSDAEIAAVGGRLHEADDSGERVLNRQMYFQFDPRHRHLTAIPIGYYFPVARSVAGIDVYSCDSVSNFCVFRRSAFTGSTQWDERIKTDDAHEDFFLNLKLNTHWRVVYLPSMAALKHDPAAEAPSLPGRMERRTHFLEKWNIRQYLQVGDAATDLERDPQALYTEATAPASGTDPASYQTTSGETPPLRDAGGTVMRLRSQPAVVSSARWSVPHSSLRSLLGPAEDPDPYGPGAPPIRFCYSPSRTGENLLVWCRPEPPRPSRYRKRSWFAALDHNGQKPARTALRFRWFDNAYRPLVWESDRIDVGLHEGYWSPIITPVPLWPDDVPYMRFEIVAERGDDRVMAATGFLFVERSAEIGEPDDNKVMALGVPRPVAATIQGLASPLTSVARDPEIDSRTLELSAVGSYMLQVDLTQAGLDDVQTVLFLDWESAGRRLAALDTSQAGFQLASSVAIPRPGNDGARILGKLKNGKCCRLEMLTAFPERPSSNEPKREH